MIQRKYRKPGSVYCVDASQWDFKQQIAKLGVHPSNKDFHQADKLDILLTKEGVDYDHLNNTCLFTVGGYIHYHDSDGHGIYIDEAKLTQSRLGTNHVGIISFEELGQDVRLSLHKIKGRDIYTADEFTPLHKSLLIKIPGADFRHHLMALVLCGELHWIVPHGSDMNDFIRPISHDTIKVNISKWNLLSKARKYKGLFGGVAGMRQHLTSYKDGRIKIEEVRDEAFIRALFEISQSFFVIVKTKNNYQFTEKKVHGHQIPMRYFTTAEGFGQYPLRCSDGRMLPYFVITGGNGILSVVTEGNVQYTMHSQRMRLDDEEFLHDTPISTRKGMIADAMFNIITKE